MATSRSNTRSQMSRYLLILFVTLLMVTGLQAQAQESGGLELQSSMAAASDSLVKQRELEVRSEFGFSETDQLDEVAKLLEIKDLDRWKSYLGLEPANKVLDNMNLRKLGITPYKALLAKQFSIYGFTELTTLAELASLKNIPIKKLRNLVGIASLERATDGFSLQALELDPARMDSLATEFDKATLPYGISVTLVGMLIVFTALLVTSIIIGQLMHVNKKPKMEDRHLVIDRSGKLVSGHHQIDPNVVAAAITALHLYETGIQERRRLLLTFKRTPTNQWRASQVLEMPNRELFRSRR